jgi:uncharacterized membrane protein
MAAKTFFSKEQQQEIVAAIASAELNTSGEIRLHMVDKCKNEPTDEAIKVFEKLGMTKTELRNGILIFLAVKTKKFAIIGDKGINELVSENFWDSVRDLMLNHFQKNEFSLGIQEGILLIGEKLKTHFPYQLDDENELSNEISFDA